MIDYDEMEQIALEFKPQIIIAGYSAHSRDLNYKRFREVCDKVGALLMVDMAHYCGLVAGKVLSDPFEFADVVTTTTHKMMRGPRGGMIFSKGKELSDKINFGVFPQLQGGPHMNQIAALAFALRELKTEEYTNYARQIVKNAQAFCEELKSWGFTVVSGTTENHMFLWNVRDLGLTGNKVEKILEKVYIFANKNSIQGDKSPMNPGAVRIGTPAITAWGMKEEQVKIIVGFFAKAIEIAKSI